jgi:hypothetical protein
MLKAAIIACAVCAGAALLLANTGPNEQSIATTGASPLSPRTPTAASSYQELHANAHLENLPAIHQGK